MHADGGQKLRNVLGIIELVNIVMEVRDDIESELSNTIIIVPEM